MATIPGPAVARSATGQSLAQGPPGADGLHGNPGAPGSPGPAGPPGSGIQGQATNTLVNGLNSNVPTSALATLRFAGPTDLYSVGGFLWPGSTAVPAGFTLEVVNLAAYVLTLVNEDTGSTAAYRITTQTGGPVAVPPNGHATFVYDGTALRWRLKDVGYGFSPLYPANWRGAVLPQTAPDAFDTLSNSPAGRFVFTRQFCPPALLPFFAALAGNAAAPYSLVFAFASLAAAQAAFPLSTAAGDLTGGTYATNSLDWAVLNEATRYSEANGMPTVWLDHPIANASEGAAYGIYGTITVKGGVKFMGQGSQGSNFQLGTPLIHFSSGDLFQWVGTADPSGVGNYSAGTGGGLYHMQLVKADRSQFGGVAASGGRAIYLQANGLSKRPGEMSFLDVIITAEGYTSSATWLRGLEADSSLVTSYGALGVRDVHIHKMRIDETSDPGKSVWLHGAVHWNINGLQIETGSEGVSPGITIEGLSDDVQIMPLMCYGSLTIKDTTPVAVTGATNANPIVLHAPAHGFPVGDTPQVQVFGVNGNTAANGVWVATAGDADHLTLTGASGNGAWSSGGTVGPVSPGRLNIYGQTSSYASPAANAAGTVDLTYGFIPPDGSAGYSSPTQPTNFQGGLYFTNSSPWLVIRGPNRPAFETQLYNATRSNVTGDGTLYQVVFNALDFDHDDDFHGYAASYTTWTCQVAGTYKFRARVTMTGLTAFVTSLQLRLHVASGGTNRYATAFGPAGLAVADYTMAVEESFQLLVGDTVVVELTVGGTTKTVSVIGDSGSGLTMFSGELQ